jgi:hypothetical protein
MTPLDLLNHGNFVIYNKKVAQKVSSVNAAIFIAELVNRYQYHEGLKELKDFKKHDGIWFYYTVEKCLERTVLSAKEQASAIKVLEPYKLFEKKGIGVPCKRHFKLDLKAIIEFITGSNNSYSSAQKAELDTPKRQNKKCPKGRTIKEHHQEPQEEPQKDNVKTLPFSERKKKKPFSSFLNPEQKEAHDAIINHIPQWGDKVKSKDICAWMLSKKYTPERVLESFKVYKQDVDDAIKRDDTVRSMGARICSILTSGRKPISKDAENNIIFASLKAKECRYMEITKRYVKFNYGTESTEVYLNLPEPNFRLQMEKHLQACKMEDLDSES